MFLYQNHARHPRLEKLLLICLELSRILETPTGLLNHFLVQVAVSLLKPPQRPQKRNGHHVTISEVKWLYIYNGYRTLHNGHSPTDTSVRSGVTDGHATAVVTGQVNGFILVWKSLS